MHPLRAPTGASARPQSAYWLDYSRSARRIARYVLLEVVSGDERLRLQHMVLQLGGERGCAGSIFAAFL
jgi:hypothetical protein